MAWILAIEEGDERGGDENGKRRADKENDPTPALPGEAAKSRDER